MAKKGKKTAASADKHSPSILNKKARYDYNLLEKFEAGIVLLGTEVKSLRQGKASLAEGFARIRAGQLYLVGCTIPQYEQGNIANHEPGRVRKLLVHRRELRHLESRLTQKGLTLVPLRIYFTRGLAKIEIALAEGKTHSDKREKLKTRQAERDMRSAVRKWQR